VIHAITYQAGRADPCSVLVRELSCSSTPCMVLQLDDCVNTAYVAAPAPRMLQVDLNTEEIISDFHMHKSAEVHMALAEAADPLDEGRCHVLLECDDEGLGYYMLKVTAQVHMLGEGVLLLVRSMSRGATC
jgi:hypothetical protein